MKKILYVDYIKFIFVPIGVLITYIIYRSPFFSFSAPEGYWLFATITIGTLGSIIMILKLLLDNKFIDMILFLFIGVSIGFYGPLALGRTIPYLNDRPINSEIYELDLLQYDLSGDLLPEISNVSDYYQISIESVGGNKYIVFASANVRTNDFATVDNSLTHPESILSLVEIKDSTISLIDQVSLSQEFGIHHGKDLFLNQDKLYISTVHVDADGCQSLQLIEFKVNSELLLTLSDNKLVFESSPKLCGRNNPLQSGGRITLIDENTLLLSVGDFRLGPSSNSEEVNYDGRPSEMTYPNTYGMIIAIDLTDFGHEPYSIGHRNPQGLFFDEVTGNIWSSEHGPSGGGELNLIIQNNDYGWPDKTLGIPYGPNFVDGDWNTDRWSNHEGFTNPILSWIPSIAPSQLVVYRGEEFNKWSGDILLATLRDNSLRRIRLYEDRVLYDERIYIGERVRDLLILEDGSILMSFDSGKIGLLRNNSY